MNQSNDEDRMTHTSLDSARETIAVFDRQVAELEQETREVTERMRLCGEPYAAIAKEWDRCGERTRPIRQAREKLVEAMVTIMNMTQPPKVIIPKNESH